MTRIEEACDYIVRFCPRIGAFYGSLEAHAFLLEIAPEIASAQPSEAFPDRHKEHIAYAVEMAASKFSFSPPAAIASLYLATQLEFFFRILSGKLNGDGTWKSCDARRMAQAALEGRSLPRDRVSNVALAYRVMKTNRSLRITQACQGIDDALFPKPMVAAGNVELRDIGDRIAYCRHRAAHGHWGDISSEAVFYGLMTAIVFCAQTPEPS
jgi:hypothetical protein